MCYISSNSVCLKKIKLYSIGGYKYGFYGEDYELWVRSALSGLKFHNLKEVVLNIESMITK